MFTGLVETTGKVLELTRKGESAQLVVDASGLGGETKLGESIAVNGCCLTVTSFEQGRLSFDLLAQTLDVTSLGELKSESWVNLERALRPGDRLGGHYVQGHVDGTVEVVDWSPHGQDFRLEVRKTDGWQGLVVPKGSICLDGISLTAALVGGDNVVCWIIPHTLERTHLKAMEVGRRMNLEFDLLGKYVESLLISRGLVGKLSCESGIADES